MTVPKRCEKFLRSHHLLTSQYDAEAIQQAFLKEMERGLTPEGSCLAMIPSFIQTPSMAPKNERIIVLDAGGSNFRTSLFYFDEQSTAHKEYFSTHAMPGIEKELSKKEFFDQIIEYIKPVLGKSDRLGFCFSYPSRIDSTRDGTLIYWTKEIKAPEIVGEKICANLIASLQEKKLPVPTTCTLLNDTVASLFAGIATNKFNLESNYIGFILGTGTNTAYLEANKHIKKLRPLEEKGTQAINIESANFNTFIRSDLDKAFDKTTAEPGTHILEKMISGGYLGNLCLCILKMAASENLFSPETQRILENTHTLSSKEVSECLELGIANSKPFQEIAPNDRDELMGVISEIVDRAALFAAINISATMIKASQAKVSKQFCISADGSLYYKLYSFQEKAEQYLKNLLSPFNFDYSIMQVSDAPLLGAAVAGFSQ